MPRSLVMTLIGDDRPGLVEALSAAIEAHGGNWQESRMVHLAGQFAGLLHVQVPGERLDELRAELGRLDGVSVAVVQSADDTPPADTRLLGLDVVGQDHPGIVHRLSRTLAARGVNLEEMETEVFSAPMSGEATFRFEARLRAPRSLDLETLEQELERLAADLMVEVRLAPDRDAG